MIPNLNPVKGSSNIKAVGYDPATKQLAIEYRDTAVYVYRDFPPEKFAQFMQAESKGKFAHVEIKGKYPHSKLPSQPKTQ